MNNIKNYLVSAFAAIALSLTLAIVTPIAMSPSRFQHLFKAQVGMTPAHYLRALRREQARKLLQTSLLTVKQIMSGVGVEDKSHFAREFKKAYGLTPSAYRAAHLLAEEVKTLARK